MAPLLNSTELLLEVNAWTGFTDAFTHVSNAETRLEDHAVSVCRAPGFGALWLAAEAETGRPAISKDVARDVVWAMNSPECYRLLVDERGWTGEMFESWLADAWQWLLLDDPASTGQVQK